MDGLQGLRTLPLARRGMMTGLIAGFTLATQRVEAQAIHTDAAGLVAGEMKVPVSDGRCRATLPSPPAMGRFRWCW